MPLDLPKLRKLVALDESDALSRFALGKKLWETAGGAEPAAPDAALLAEAAEHLGFANQKDPTHLASYHVLGQVLVRLGRRDEARRVLEAGISRVAEVGHGMGRDLGPLMRQMLDAL